MADSADKRQNVADVSTFVCMITFGILIFLFINQPSGAEALWLMFPMIIVGFLHLILGVQAIVAAVSTGRFKRNLWIYAYFIGVVVYLLVEGGFFGEVEGQLRASYEEYEFADEVALYKAIGKGQVDEVERLIENGADTSICFQYQREYRHYNPTQYSVEHGNAEVLAVILATGVDANAHCREQFDRGVIPALFTASAKLDVEMVDALLAHGARTNPEEHRENALGMAIAGKYYSLPYNPREASFYREKRDFETLYRVVDLLLASGADVNAEQNHALPVEWAVVYGDRKLLDVLVDAGADINFSDRVPLVTTAIRHGNKDMIQHLVNLPDINLTAGVGFSALRQAGESENYAVLLPLLLEKGLDISMLTAPEHPDVTDTTNYRRIDLVEEMHQALLDGKQLLFETYLKSGADINATNDRGRLLVGLFAHDAGMLDKLLAAGAEIDGRNRTGGTALHYYAGCKSCSNPVRAIENLVAAGADVNALDSRRFTPLRRAQRASLWDTEQAILAAGGEIRVGQDE